MTAFEPFVYRPTGPRAGGQQQSGQPQQQDPTPRKIEVSVVVPVAREIDLQTVSGEEVAIPGDLYTRDYFLMHATDASVQRITISASAEYNQPKALGLRFVRRKGQVTEELTDWRRYSLTPTEPESIDDPVPTFEGALFLRVEAVSQITVLYVTLEVLTSQVF